jgi:serine/threonine protein kinase
LAFLSAFPDKRPASGLSGGTGNKGSSLHKEIAASDTDDSLSLRDEAEATPASSSEAVFGESETLAGDSSPRAGNNGGKDVGNEPSECVGCGLSDRGSTFKHTHKLRIGVLEGTTFLNDYIVVDALGHGSFGKVKLCLNVNDDGLYAVKVVDKRLIKQVSKSRRLQERFQRMPPEQSYSSTSAQTPATSVFAEAPFDDLRREVEIMRALDHPNLVKLYEVIDDPASGKLLMVMEYCEAGALIRPGQLSPERRMPEAIAQYYFRQMVLGVAYLHENGVVHGDIKPENVLLAGDATVKIADFGQSRFIQAGDDRLRRTLGTPAYLAPEVCAGMDYRGRAADVWALGVSLYLFIYGELPFQGDSMLELYENITAANVPFPENVPVSMELQDLLLRTLCKDDSHRISVTELLQHPWVRNEDFLSLMPGVSVSGGDFGSFRSNSTSNGRKSSILLGGSMSEEEGTQSPQLLPAGASPRSQESETSAKDSVKASPAPSEVAAAVFPSLTSHSRFGKVLSTGGSIVTALCESELAKNRLGLRPADRLHSLAFDSVMMKSLFRHGTSEVDSPISHSRRGSDVPVSELLTGLERSSNDEETPLGMNQRAMDDGGNGSGDGHGVSETKPVPVPHFSFRAGSNLLHTIDEQQSGLTGAGPISVVERMETADDLIGASPFSSKSSPALLPPPPKAATTGTLPRAPPTATVQRSAVSHSEASPSVTTAESGKDSEDQRPVLRRPSITKLLPRIQLKTQKSPRSPRLKLPTTIDAAANDDEGNLHGPPKAKAPIEKYCFSPGQKIAYYSGYGEANTVFYVESGTVELRWEATLPVTITSVLSATLNKLPSPPQTQRATAPALGNLPEDSGDDWSFMDKADSVAFAAHHVTNLAKTAPFMSGKESEINSKKSNRATNLSSVKITEEGEGVGEREEDEMLSVALRQATDRAKSLMDNAKGSSIDNLLLTKRGALQYVGALSMLDPAYFAHRWHASAVAVTEVCGIRMTRQGLDAFLSTNPLAQVHLRASIALGRAEIVKLEALERIADVQQKAVRKYTEDSFVMKAAPDASKSWKLLEVGKYIGNTVTEAAEAAAGVADSVAGGFHQAGTAATRDVFALVSKIRAGVAIDSLWETLLPVATEDDGEKEEEDEDEEKPAAK